MFGRKRCLSLFQNHVLAWRSRAAVPTLTFRYLLLHSTTPQRSTGEELNLPNYNDGDEDDNKYKHKKTLNVAIVGLPNAGKSQLLNVLTETPVAAVSRKRHTTRRGLLGVRTVVAASAETATQLIFVDTPGFLRQSQQVKGLDRGVMSTAPSELSHVDYSLLVVDAAKRLTDTVKASLAELILLNQNKKFAVVLNKVDLVHPKSDLLDTAMEIGDLAEECMQHQRQNEGKDDDSKASTPEEDAELLPMFFYISALKNDGVDDLLDFLVQKAIPCDEFEVSVGAATNLSPEERVEEVIREKLYRCLHKEVPYSIRQKNRLFQVVRKPQLGLIVQQDLMVRTKSHQELVHGSGNRTLERIRETAVRDVQRILGCPVDLHLHVKLVKSKNWSI